MASNAQPIQSVFALLTRKEGVSFEFFKDYYENKHIPMVNKLVGVDKYITSWTRNYFLQSKSEAETLKGYGTDGWDFDAITEIKPKSQKALNEMWEKFKEVQEVIAEDEARFCDREKGKSYFVIDVKLQVFE